MQYGAVQCCVVSCVLCAVRYVGGVRVSVREFERARVHVVRVRENAIIVRVLASAKMRAQEHDKGKKRLHALVGK